MTTDVIGVTPTTTLPQIADLFETRHIRRVPVIADGRVVGIVSRANLVQALAVIADRNQEGVLNDRQVRDLVLAEYKLLPWGFGGEGNVIVTDGVVHLWGHFPSNVEVDALRLAAETVPGVKGFVDHTYRYLGDTGVRPHTVSTLTLIGPDTES
jgi:hypothetical protein